jgi:uncharacterized membrane protein
MKETVHDRTGEMPGADRVQGLEAPIWDRTYAVFVLVLAAILRLVQLGRDGLWADECHTAYLGQHDLRWIVEAAALDFQAPLYFMINSPVVRIFGHSEWQVRSFSALVGVATVPVVLALGRRFFSPATGRIAAFLFAISPMAVHYGREARGYGLLMLLCAVMVGVALDAVVRPSVGRAIILALLGLTVIYTHNVGLFYVAGIAVAIVVCHPRWDVLRMWIGTAFLVVLGYLPWVPVILRQVTEVRSSFTWVAALWDDEFPWHVPRSLAAFTHGALPPVRNQVFDLPLSAWIGFALCLGLVVLGYAGRKRLRRQDAQVVFLVATVFPLAAIFLYSWVSGNKMYIIGRVDSAALPMFLLAVAAGVEILRPRLRWIVPVAFAGLAIHPLEVALTVDTRSQERAIANYISSVRYPEEIVVTSTFNHCMALYGRLVAGDTLFPFPTSTSHRLEYPDWTGYDEGGLREDARMLTERTVEASRQHAATRIWLLVGGVPRQAVVAEVMDQMLEPISRSETGYRGVEIRSYAVPNEGTPSGSE